MRFFNNNKYIISCSLMIVALLLGGCVTKKKKGDPSVLGKVYHNTTAKYNGYFNANELYKESVGILNDGYEDNYNQILPLYPYVATDQEKSQESNFDKAIEKTSKVISEHRVSYWADDCYLLMGQCRYAKKDYENAKATFEYLAAEYNPEAIAKRKKKKKKKKKKSSKKKKEKEEPESYFLKHRPAYQEGLIWLARTYIERKEYDQAENIISAMERDPKTEKSLVADLAEVHAYYFLSQKEYTQATSYLEKALETTNARAKKRRYAYILAQINQDAGSTEKAYAYFGKVLNLGPPYDMEFNARLNQVKNGWVSGKENAASVIKSLTKMSKDTKNKEYRDQIYYTIAEVQLSEGDRGAAITSLQQSLNYNTKNKSLKAEDYLLLGDLYFEAEDYVNAKLYYDSTLTVLSVTDERFTRVTGAAGNLLEIAKNIQEITLQDSLLRVGKMTKEEQKEIAAAIKLAAEAKKQASQNQTTPNKISSTNSLGASKSNFFAYDDRAVKRGKRVFERQWGNRPLADNWRRSSNSSAFQEGEAEVASAETINITDAEVAEILKDVPRDEKSIAAANAKIEKSLFQLGMLFRDRLKNYQKSITSLEQLLARYNNTSHKLDAYYYLYLDYTDIGNKAEATKYYNRIVKEFPETTYARALKDPNFLEDANQKEQKLVAYYDKTYEIFSEGQYKPAFDRISNADNLFGVNNSLKPKFKLLEAFCRGKLEGKEAYISTLKEVIAKYPNTDEERRAKEILRFLQGDSASTTPSTTPSTKPDTNNPNSDIYQFEPTKSHFLLAVLTDGKDDIREIKENVNTYNEKNFKDKRLRANTIFLDPSTNSPYLIVRRFRNKDEAMEYYNAISKNIKDYLGVNLSAEVYVVSQTNYRTILKNKNVDGYAAFFQENYTK